MKMKKKMKMKMKMRKEAKDERKGWRRKKKKGGGGGRTEDDLKTFTHHLDTRSALSDTRSRYPHPPLHNSPPTIYS